MFQRVLGNISNVTDNKGKNVLVNGSNKRVAEVELNHPLKKKGRPTFDNKEPVKNVKRKILINKRRAIDENLNQPSITQTIECKVKSISLDDRKILKKIDDIDTKSGKLNVKVETQSNLKTEIKPIVKVETKPPVKNETRPIVKMIEKMKSVDLKKEKVTPIEVDNEEDDCIIIEDLVSVSEVINKAKENETIVKIKEDPTKYDQRKFYVPTVPIPEDVEDHDATQDSALSEPFYAHDVFLYYKMKEKEMRITKYMHRQTEISGPMRAILVDWLVEAQETLELNHEVLYTAVKIVDSYCMRSNIKKSRFQLLGICSIFIAAKLDERILPPLNEFLFLHGEESELKAMEIEILTILDFKLMFPLSYRFLRRYARVGKLSMETLTLARFILEMSLLDYDLVDMFDSQIAAASLKLALLMKDQNEREETEDKDAIKTVLWTPTLKFYSGYSDEDLAPLVNKLNLMISKPSKLSLRNVRNKYSHKIFYEVAKMKPLPIES